MVDRRSEYLKRKNTPTPFNQGPEMQNYNRMMDLQSQAPNFAKNDPRLDELKDVRRLSLYLFKSFVNKIIIAKKNENNNTVKRTGKIRLILFK